MGSFYLDIIKDRQYTTAKTSLARRSCQTAMYYILQALTRWLAPILSFTAEEIWQHIPGAKGESVFLEQWFTAWPTIEAINMMDWEQLSLVRNEVNKALEETRKQGVIGSALAAEVTVYADAVIAPKLTRLGEELRFLLITSAAQVLPLEEAPAEGVFATDMGVVIQVKASEQEKCARCWHRCADIGQDLTHPELCLRCSGNIQGQAEIRKFA